MVLKIHRKVYLALVTLLKLLSFQVLTHLPYTSYLSEWDPKISFLLTLKYWSPFCFMHCCNLLRSTFFYLIFCCSSWFSGRIFSLFLPWCQFCYPFPTGVDRANENQPFAFFLSLTPAIWNLLCDPKGLSSPVCSSWLSWFFSHCLLQAVQYNIPLHSCTYSNPTGSWATLC